MATALLFVVWTAWLLIALWLLGLKRRAWLIAIFVPFAIVVLIARDHAWRPYLIGWLGVHALVSGYDALDARYRQINNADRASIDGSDRAGTALRRVLPPVISISGLLWLWIDGGARYWQYIAGALLAMAGCALAMWLGHRVRVIYRARIQRQIDEACSKLAQQAAAEREGLLAEHRDTVRGRDAQLEAGRAQLQDAQRRCREQADRRALAERRNRELDSRLSALSSQIEQLRRELDTCRARAQAQQEHAAQLRKAETQLVSDAFFCTACRSVWLITTRPGRQEVRRPAGAGCTICSGPTGIMQPPSPAAGPGRTPAPPMVLAHPAQPTSQTPTAGRAHDHAMIGAYVAVDLAALDSTTAADDLAQWADGLLWDEISRAFPAEHCQFLSAIADALDAVPDGIAEGVAWCARIAGAPEAIADLLGAIAKLTIESQFAPLHAVAQEIRLVGTARCALEGADHLTRCQCARGLVRSLSDQAAAAALDRILAPAIERLKDLEMPSPVGPTPVPAPPPIEPPSPSPFSPF